MICVIILQFMEEDEYSPFIVENRSHKQRKCKQLLVEIGYISVSYTMY